MINCVRPDKIDRGSISQKQSRPIKGGIVLIPGRLLLALVDSTGIAPASNVVKAIEVTVISMSPDDPG